MRELPELPDASEVEIALGAVSSILEDRPVTQDMPKEVWAEREVLELERQRLEALLKAIKDSNRERAANLVKACGRG